MRTIEQVTGAADRSSAFTEAVDNGDIRFTGVGVTGRIKWGLVNLVMEIAAAL